MGQDRDMQLARRARLVGVVMVATMLLWFAAQYLGGRLGLEVRYVFLFDFLALAAFAWALINVFWIWRARQSDEG
ncbi:hypothetical protein BV394_13535 [Brevirhabdus pacifica]|uniref:Uncharacterized protein n=1 Tax=Brevirhabdus pacifica TaxID=1267768 RepID=A0A1U7DKW4_9RHOB|nr:DUF5337 domain-containing protein [Brevirhabdus pacifica]APX90612.1 hypothetical protein BV394_13535 [Brevirhabdus pacifica]OWU78395.1 hypothetical protein ATO5_05930 [Loktanella sp. 22II-4b]PJJ85249.1 hypothetical protein CLV77_2115 [Brevirhabdus pacifica]